MKLLAYKLACTMANSEFTAGKLSMATGLSSKSITQYMAGNTTPKPSTVGKIAKALNVTPEYLTEGDGANAK